MKKIFFLILLIPSISFGQLDSLRAHFTAGQEAYKAGNYPLFLNEMIRSDAFRPYYPPVMYNLAAGYSLNEKINESSEALRTFISTNSTVAFEEDTDFENLKKDPAYVEIINLKQQLSQPVGQSIPFQQIDGTSHVESVTYDPKSGIFYLGDVRDPKIYQVKDGKVTDRIETEHPDFYSVMGLDIDFRNQLLWICTAALPQMAGYGDSLENHSSLFSYHLQSRELRHHRTLRLGTTFGDLIVGPKGEVLISDGNSNKIYSYFPKVGLNVLADVSGTVFNLQGLALSGDQKFLYFSDYISGLHRISLEDKLVQKLSFSGGTPFKGIDGLYWLDNSLIGIENGSKPIRIVRFHLKDASITSFEILDQNQEYLDEPTQGILNGSEFLFISNSPWSRYDKENNFQSPQEPLALRRITIKN